MSAHPEGDRLIDLVRVAYRDDGTLGVLRDHGTELKLDTPGEPFAVTLEPPWRDNAPRISCIPVGAYRCRRVRSPKFGNTFEIVDVPGRDAILFHAGNWVRQTEGCVITAESFERLDGHIAVAQSGKGFAEFLERLDGWDEFLLQVRESNA